MLLPVAPSRAESWPRVHDLTPQFIRFWKHAKGKTDKARIEAFKRDVVSTFPEFYEHSFQKWSKGGKNTDEELKKQFAEFGASERAFIARAGLLRKDIGNSLRTFLRRFPDMKTDFDVYVLHSMGEGDGGIRGIAGKRVFFLGVDMIVKYHKAATDVPFFHHEFFHVYYGQFSKESAELYKSLWDEGLATHVAEVLNPGSTLRDLMLDVPEGLAAKCNEMMDFLLKDLQGKLLSKDERVYTTYFLPWSTDPKIPKRAAYYLGYLVAKEIAKSTSLDEMVRLSGEPLLERIKSALGALSSQGAPASGK